MDIVMDNDTDTHKGKYKGRVMHVKRVRQMDRVRRTDQVRNTDTDKVRNWERDTWMDNDRNTVIEKI
jgi:hypothetical protein